MSSSGIAGSLGFPGGAVVKNLHGNAGYTRDVGLIHGLERSPGVGNENLLQYTCLENSVVRGAWQARLPDTTEQLNTQLIYSIVLVSVAQCSNSVIYVFILSQIIFSM